MTQYNFCTIFNSSYFAKGLALYFSLEKVCNFHLYIFTSDESSVRLLKEKKLNHATIIPISEIENAELLAVKPKRDIAEYFWTIKAYCIEYLFNSLNLDAVSYVDADTYFYSDPRPFFDEIGNDSVLIIPHNFSPKYKGEIKNGIFNAGYITFKNTEPGYEILRWWKVKCTEWCYKKKENGKFGDQMYLNSIADMKHVKILKHNGALANWNVQQYNFTRKNGKLFGLTNSGKSFEVVFFHFHYHKFYSNGDVEFGRKFLSKTVLELFYIPYTSYLYSLASLELNGAVEKKFTWKTPIISLRRKIERTYNIFSIRSLLDKQLSQN